MRSCAWRCSIRSRRDEARRLCTASQLQKTAAHHPCQRTPRWSLLSRLTPSLSHSLCLILSVGSESLCRTDKEITRTSKHKQRPSSYSRLPSYEGSKGPPPIAGTHPFGLLSGECFRSGIYEAVSNTCDTSGWALVLDLDFSLARSVSGAGSNESSGRQGSTSRTSDAAISNASALTDKPTLQHTIG